MDQLKQYNLQENLNDFFSSIITSLDTQVIEEFFSVLEKNDLSMRFFLDALVSSELWQEWQIQPNPYVPMIMQVGSAIDHFAQMQPEPAYHSKRHMMDVCLTLSYLLCHEKDSSTNDIWHVSNQEKWLLLLGAAMHDLGHPGLINAFSFELEKNSLALLKESLNKIGMDSVLIDEVLNTLSPWVLATDHGQYSALLNRLLSSQPSHTDCLAMLLVEADLVSSVLPNRGRELTRRLIKEWALPYPDRSQALSNQTGYRQFLNSLNFISPYSVRAGIPEILKNTIIKNEY
ncbi:hypothetical protein [Polynucleobacter rarus]|uniref:hypothetical protein n=1 Tax=Polynucleobacter rarus TaxID=556055 RepID=UPI00131EE22D|nr:hypothetical protein [Polynucleobacter rarus]